MNKLKLHVQIQGIPCILASEHRLLLCLHYWREYWTLFHVCMAYGIPETTASRIVRHVEDCLVKFNLFNLEKKLPKDEGLDWDVVIVDARVIPIQRRQKIENKL